MSQVVCSADSLCPEFCSCWFTRGRPMGGLEKTCHTIAHDLSTRNEDQLNDRLNSSGSVVGGDPAQK